MVGAARRRHCPVYLRRVESTGDLFWGNRRESNRQMSRQERDIITE